MITLTADTGETDSVAKAVALTEATQTIPQKIYTMEPTSAHNRTAVERQEALSRWQIPVDTSGHEMVRISECVGPYVTQGTKLAWKQGRTDMTLTKTRSFNQLTNNPLQKKTPRPAKDGAPCHPQVQDITTELTWDQNLIPTIVVRERSILQTSNSLYN